MAEHMLNDESRFKLIGLLAENPSLTQRQLARELGISVGKVNYCLRALLETGYVKATNFKNNQKKSAYLYQLTPEGVAAKAKATRQFLARKQAEYECLAVEIEQLRRDALAICNEP